MTETRPLASDIHLGGSNVSISMLGTWWRCPRMFYWQYLHPHDGRTERGFEPKFTNSPLAIGSAVHIALAAYYLSDKWTEPGGAALEVALDAARKMFEARSDEFESPDRYAADLGETERILRGYYAEYGPESRAPEYPDFKPLAVEQTYAIKLRSGHTLTVRPDAVAEYFGHIVVVENKVPAASKVASTIGSAALGAQGLAQAAVLRNFDLPTTGMLLNIQVRGDNRKAGYTRPSKPFQRPQIAFEPALVDDMLDFAADTVLDIQSKVHKWYDLCADRMAPVEAARATFAMAGLFNGQCHQGFHPCDFATLCQSPGREYRGFNNFRVRVYKMMETPTTLEVE